MAAPRPDARAHNTRAPGSRGLTVGAHGRALMRAAARAGKAWAGGVPPSGARDGAWGGTSIAGGRARARKEHHGQRTSGRRSEGCALNVKRGESACMTRRGWEGVWRGRGGGCEGGWAGWAAWPAPRPGTERSWPRDYCVVRGAQARLQGWPPGIPWEAPRSPPQHKGCHAPWLALPSPACTFPVGETSAGPPAGGRTSSSTTSSTTGEVINRFPNRRRGSKPSLFLGQQSNGKAHSRALGFIRALYKASISGRKVLVKGGVLVPLW
jgi:hypothetical protein